jgi:hypothetical protein
MKKRVIPSIFTFIIFVSGLFLNNLSATGQETSKLLSSLPDNINNIVSVSCMPCHSSNGGLLSRTKLNFTEWSKYSSEKQKAKAEKMYSELKKGAMPPKSARETRPDIIPTSEQIDIIKKWAKSLKTDIK